MSTGNEDYVLGKEITSAAKSKTQQGTAVVSVRLATEEVARLERITRATGKSISQVIREAIAAYEASPINEQPHLTFSVAWSGSVVAVGGYRPESGTLVHSEFALANS